MNYNQDFGWLKSDEYKAAFKSWRSKNYLLPAREFDYSEEFRSARLIFKNRIQRMKD